MDILNIYTESIKAIYKTNLLRAALAINGQLEVVVNFPITFLRPINFLHPIQMNHNNHQVVDLKLPVGHQERLPKDRLKDVLLDGQLVLFFSCDHTSKIYKV